MKTQVGVLFPVEKKRKVRTVTDLDRDLAYFRGRYEAVRGERLVRANWAQEAHDMKRLRDAVPDETLRHALIDIWVEDTSPFVVERGHLLRYALLEWRFQQLIREAQARVQAAARPMRVVSVDPGPVVGVVNPEVAREALDAARQRSYRRRNGHV